MIIPSVHVGYGWSPMGVFQHYKKLDAKLVFLDCLTILIYFSWTK